MDPNPPTRSFSASSSSSNITRVGSGPMMAAALNLNRKASANDSLYYVCLNLKTRLQKVPGMEPYLSLAHTTAEINAEQQALALSQHQKNRISGFSSSGDMRDSGYSLNSSNSDFDGYTRNNIYTFSAGVLPSMVKTDPVTHMWKLFQQGAPLCLLFNAIMPENKLPVTASNDMRVCKRSVYDFILACKNYLKFDDEFMVPISYFFSDSTTDLLQVIKVVNMVLDQKPEYDISTIEPELATPDSRSKIIKELVESERKYVQDLELLLKYKLELLEAQCISNEQIHTLFPNLQEIVDFQRRLLVALECNAFSPPMYQRIGSVLLHAGSGPFKAYEPWTVGQMAAIELINKETVKLKSGSTLLDPGFELQSYLIKPVQRLCKYPLLLKELLAYSDASWSNYIELDSALQSTKEVANHVNEAQRRAENIEVMKDLSDRVANWRGFNLRDQGELLYHGVLGVKDSDSEKEYVAYLFERIIFFFVEVVPQTKKQLLTNRKKSSSSVNMSSVSLSTQNSNPLELKGRVFISEIFNINSQNSGNHTLVISWSGKKESGSFTLRYRSEEAKNQWENCLRQLKQNEYSGNRNSTRNSNDSDYDIAGDYASRFSPVTESNGSARSSVNSFGQRHHSSSISMGNSRTTSVNSYSAYDGETRSRSLSQGGLHGLNSLLTPITTFQSEEGIKIILTYKNGDNEIVINAATKWDEVRHEIYKKLTTLDKQLSDVLKLKYEDEDGDFVVMESSDDWTLAVDSMSDGGADRTLKIWAS